MEWYVIQAYSGYEQKVKAALQERIELNNLSEKFGEILIPTEQIVELKGGAKKTTERKFFPGYILVQMNLEDDSWQLVQSTPRVSGFVGGTRDKPLPISEEDVNNIINIERIRIKIFSLEYRVFSAFALLKSKNDFLKIHPHLFINDYKKLIFTFFIISSFKSSIIK